MAALDTAQRGPSIGQPHLELGKIHPAYLSLFAFPKLRPPTLWLSIAKVTSRTSIAIKMPHGSLAAAPGGWLVFLPPVS